MFNKILVVIFEFTGAARGFMIISCAARGVKKVGQHCSRHSRHRHLCKFYRSL